jgi:hypothetical protein
VASLEDRIDELYQAPLSAFVSARAALVSTLGGEEAKRVKALKKPTVVPWAVNQLFWLARASYERAMKRGIALRRAQVSSLKGRSADVRQATEAHREAVAHAVKEATRLAAARGARVNADALAQTIEALSLAEHTPEPAGRLTSSLQAAGFAALAGVTITASAHRRAEASSISSANQAEAESAKIDAERVRQAARAERARASAIRKAERALDRARTREEAARRAWDHARAELDKAEREFTLSSDPKAVRTRPRPQ